MLANKRIKKSKQRRKSFSALKYRQWYSVGYVCLSSLLGFIFFMLVSGLFVYSYNYLTSCHYFELTQINILGNQRVCYQNIIDTAQIYPGKNILSINLAKVRKQLMANPWIIEAEVSRELPDKIHISIKEHIPYAILDLGRKFLINRQGEIFKEWIPEDPINLPLIQGFAFSDINVSGKNRSKIFSAVMDFLHLGMESESVLGHHDIQAIKVDREMGLTVFAPEYAGGRIGSIKIGFDNYRHKLNCLKQVVLYLQHNRFNDYFETIDLNNSERIVLNPATPNIVPVEVIR